MDNDTMVAVTPEDRELVYGLLMPAARTSLQKLALEYIRDGKSDDADAVQQVARHRHKSGRTGAGERETVARVIHQCLRPVNMANADWDSGAILGADNSWRRSVYSTADHILAALAQPVETGAALPSDGRGALREAAQAVIATADDYYTARNGRRMSIEGEDGEKCWIVPFDPFEDLRRALTAPDNWLTISVDEAAQTIGIDHPSKAAWADVYRAMVAVRDHINDRITKQGECPIRPAALAQPVEAGEDGLREAMHRALREVAKFDSVRASEMLEAMDIYAASARQALKDTPVE